RKREPSVPAESEGEGHSADRIRDDAREVEEISGGAFRYDLFIPCPPRGGQEERWAVIPELDLGHVTVDLTLGLVTSDRGVSGHGVVLGSRIWPG
ncbi:hypothetical protein RRG08_000984, partial [Elysia crispata]